MVLDQLSSCKIGYFLLNIKPVYLKGTDYQQHLIENTPYEFLPARSCRTFSSQSTRHLEAIRREGEHELERPASSLAWSGLAAGLSMGFSMVAQALLGHYLPEADW